MPLGDSAMHVLAGPMERESRRPAIVPGKELL